MPVGELVGPSVGAAEVGVSVKAGGLETVIGQLVGNKIGDRVGELPVSEGDEVGGSIGGDVVVGTGA